MAVDWGKIESILGSRTGEAALNIGGGLIQGIAQGQQADKDRAALDRRFGTESQLSLAQQYQNDARTRAVAAADASPLGANEQFAARQAFMNAVLPGLRNFSATPGDPAVAAAMGSVKGGFRLPEGGLPKEALAAFSPQATANAIAQRQGHISNIDPNAPGVDFASMGFTPEVSGQFQPQTDAYQATRRQAMADEQSRTQELLRAALERDYQAQQAQQKKGSGFWGKLGGVLKTVAPVAAAFIPGVGPLAAAGIAAAGSAAGTKMQGGSWGQAAMSGAMGAGSQAALGALGRAVGSPAINRTPGINPTPQNELLSAALRRSPVYRR